jgi:protein-tyrosine phosphatase
MRLRTPPRAAQRGLAALVFTVTEALNRDLIWDGLLNVRDLGGHRTEDGGETRFGEIVRADTVRRLSKEGWQALLDYGIHTIVDLRTDQELEADPPAELPVTVVHVPFLEENAAVFEEVEAAAAKAPDYATATRDVYLIFLERFRENVAAAVTAIADAPEGGVVVHCMGGKDRTGLTTAFLLRMAGVAIEDIAADYALSEERLRPRHEAWLAEAETEAEREQLRRIAATPAESMVGVLEEIERRYGNVEEYLRAGGAPEDIGERVRARLRG